MKSPIALELEAIAKSHGFETYAQMVEAAEAGEIIDKDERIAIANDLIPHAKSPKHISGYGIGGLSQIDADAVRAIARLIRILLIGYTEEELEEMQEHLDELNADLRAQDGHRIAIERLTAIADASPAPRRPRGPRM